MFPVITKPTRVTESPGTLIDHIPTNNFDIGASHHQDILWSSISNHYAIFHVAGNVTNGSNMINPIVRRDMCHKNLLKIVNEMEELDWQGVIDENDQQSAYNRSHEIVSSKYNVCFSYHKFSKRYHMSQPGLSAALKQSINEKNKLFVIRKKQNDKENVIHFKKYRNILNQLIRSTERKHYHDLLVEHKSNTIKSWQIIKSVINKRKYKLPSKIFFAMEVLLVMVIW